MKKTIKPLEKLSVCVSRLVVSVCDPMDCSPPGSSIHGILQATILDGVGYHDLLQGILLTLGSNAGLPHCRQTAYCLSHQGCPSTKLQEKLKACLSMWKDIACLCIGCFTIKMSVLC